MEYGKDSEGRLNPGFVKLNAEEVRELAELLKKLNAGKNEGKEEQMDVLIAKDKLPQQTDPQPVQQNIPGMDKLIGMLADALGLAKMIRDGKVSTLRKVHADEMAKIQEREQQMVVAMVEEYRKVIMRQRETIAELEQNLHHVMQQNKSLEQQICTQNEEISRLQEEISRLRGE